MLRAFWIAAAVFLSAANVLGAGEIGKPSPAAWLQWSTADTPPACGTRDAFAKRVEQALGRSAEQEVGGGPLTVVTHIARVPAEGVTTRWVGKIEVLTRERTLIGSRTLDHLGPSCQPLVDALAMVTALVLTDEGTNAASEKAQPNRSEALAPPPPRLDATIQVQAEAPHAPSRWDVGVEGGARLGVGLLPHLALGFEAVAFVRRAEGAGLFLAADLWDRQTAVDSTGKGASLDRFAFGIGLSIPVGAWRRWAGSVSARGDGGWLRTTGLGFASSSTQTRLTIDVGAAVEVRRQVWKSLSLVATAGLAVPLIRDRVAYGTATGGAADIFRPAPVAGVGALRLILSF